MAAPPLSAAAHELLRSVGDMAPVAVTAMDFMAFRQLNHTAYCQYAGARTGCRSSAEGAVEETFAGLAVVWEETLSGPCPAAVAWYLLGRSTGRRAAAREASVLHRLLQAEYADAMLLRHQLNMPLTAAAGMMGIDVPVMKARLSVAERELQPCPAARSRRAPGVARAGSTPH